MYDVSLPMRGEWIEIARPDRCEDHDPSLPMRGEWIEMSSLDALREQMDGLSPCGESGLKLKVRTDIKETDYVSPHAGRVD